MQNDIGKIAGEIWHYLKENDAVTVSRLVREIDGTERIVLIGIGWLACEKKLDFKKQKHRTYVTLKTSEIEDT